MWLLIAIVVIRFHNVFHNEIKSWEVGNWCRDEI